MGRRLEMESLVGTHGVVLEAKVTKGAPEVGQGAGYSVVAQPGLKRSMEAFDLALGLWMSDPRMDEVYALSDEKDAHLG